MNGQLKAPSLNLGHHWKVHKRFPNKRKTRTQENHSETFFLIPFSTDIHNYRVTPLQ